LDRKELHNISAKRSINGVFAGHYAIRGIISDHLGRHEDAMADYRTALSGDPELAEGMHWLDRLLYNVQERPPTIADRLAYLEAQLALPPEATVVEIGAGLGALTEPLAQRVARVLALEVDRGCCRVLRARLAALPNVEIRCEDALTFPWAAHAGAYVVGAIPYHITSPLLVALADAGRAVRAAWIILQEEVAQRLLASKTERDAQKGLLFLGVLAAFACSATYIIGAAMRTLKPEFFPDRADEVFMYVMLHMFPVGVKGLLVAGMMAI